MLLFRWLPILLSFAIFSALPAHAGHKPPQIVLRIHIQTSGEGLAQSQATVITLPPNGEAIQIRAMPEVTEQDIVDVQTDSSGAVHLFLNHRGKINLDAATGQNQGRILVVLLNGVVIYAPVIDEQISSGEFVIPRPLPPEAIALLKETAKQNVRDAPPPPRDPGI